MRLTFGTLGLCAWLGDVEAERTLILLNTYGMVSSAHIYYIKGCYLIVSPRGSNETHHSSPATVSGVHWGAASQ